MICTRKSEAAQFKFRFASSKWKSWTGFSSIGIKKRRRQTLFVKGTIVIWWNF